MAQAISEGITAGSIDIGAIGTSVAINGIMSKTPYKICTGLATSFLRNPD
ncbi:MAG: hypothetical protein ACLUR5_05520 [Eubacterium ventriosum]